MNNFLKKGKKTKITAHAQQHKNVTKTVSMRNEGGVYVVSNTRSKPPFLNEKSHKQNIYITYVSFGTSCLRSMPFSKAFS